MNNFSDEDKKELWQFMGEMSSLARDMKSLKDDVSSLKKDVESMKLDFAKLKGKLVVVAGLVTFSLNAIWSVAKGAFT